MYRWTLCGPRTRLLELRGQAEQRRFVAETSGYLHSDRKRRSRSNAAGSEMAGWPVTLNSGVKGT